MQDFNSYSKNYQSENNFEQNISPDILSLINALSGKFNGKSQNELLTAIYEEAKRGKKAGTLSNKDIDAFYNTLLPFLDEKKQKILKKVVQDIKNI